MPSRRPPKTLGRFISYRKPEQPDLDACLDCWGTGFFTVTVGNLLFLTKLLCIECWGSGTRVYRDHQPPPEGDLWETRPFV